jgi:hypothetical protein
MTEILKAEMTPTGSTAVFSLEQDEIRLAAPNIQPIKLRVRRTREPLTFPRIIQLGALPNKRLRFIRPIPVELSRSGESVIASVAEFEEFGQGATSSDALDDLGHSLAELFLSLQQEENRLGPDLTRLLEILRSYLQLCH